MKKTARKQAERFLAIPSTFRQTALAFPAKVEQAVALLDRPEAAAELLNKAEAMATYSRRIKADTEIVNAIQYGKLLIQAKLGELLPARPPNDRGQGRGPKKSITSPVIDSHENTLSAYRKVARNGMLSGEC